MHKRSIAIVDDEPGFRRFAAEVARSCGFEAYETGSTAAFEEFVATRRPDIAMLELVMQESDGIEVMRRLVVDDGDGALVHVPPRASGKRNSTHGTWY